jgi:hypothetical protein
MFRNARIALAFTLVASSVTLNFAASAATFAPPTVRLPPVAHPTVIVGRVNPWHPIWPSGGNNNNNDGGGIWGGCQKLGNGRQIC